MRKRSFLVLTILMPILFVGLMAGTVMLALFNEGETKNIVVIDYMNEYAHVLQDTDQFRFVRAEGEMQDFRTNTDETTYATLVISNDLTTNPDAITLYSENQIVPGLAQVITSQFNDYLSDKKLASYNIPNIREIIEESKVVIHLQTIKWDDAGNETEGAGEVASIVGIIFTFLIYMFIFTYGGMVMSGVLEEKTNRIVEVIVSSVKPFELMMGKMIGIGLVGLTQFGIWAALIITVSLFGGTLFPDNQMLVQFSSMVTSINLIGLLFYFILFFIGGYLIYASLFAAIGAMVNAQEDTQQYMMPITILIIFAFMAGTYSAQNPDGPLAFWTSIIPLTSPIVMMVRLPFGVPTWELIVSIALLAATVVATIWIAGKIYRTGILMYGKKPDLKEIVKWLKY